MEPWQQEQMYQLQLEARAQKLPRCQCCDRPIRTEFCLDLSPFGIRARACQRCVEQYTVYTEEEQ